MGGGNFASSFFSASINSHSRAQGVFTRFRRVLLCSVTVLAAGGTLRAASQQAAASAPAAVSAQRAVLSEYCVTCHNEKLRTAELTLDTADVDHVAAGAAVWEKVVRKLRTGA